PSSPSSRRRPSSSSPESSTDKSWKSSGSLLKHPLRSLPISNERYGEHGHQLSSAPRVPRLARGGAAHSDFPERGFPAGTRHLRSRHREIRLCPRDAPSRPRRE